MGENGTREGAPAAVGLGDHASISALALSQTAISLITPDTFVFIYCTSTEATKRTNTLVNSIIALDGRSSYIRPLPLPIIWLGEKGKLLLGFS